MIPIPTQAAASGNPLVNGLLWNGWKWSFADPSRTLSYYLAEDTGHLWSPQETAAYAAALGSWATVANLNFTQTLSRSDATFVENVSKGDQMLALTGSGSVVAFHEFPLAALTEHRLLIDDDHQADYLVGQTGGVYNAQALGHTSGWSPSELNDGGYFHMVLTHELGHALGLKHPHNAQPDFPTFPGVADGNATQLGKNGQNDQFWTIMSYNAQYRFDDQGHVVVSGGNPITGLTDYGYVMGPMAYDIAAIQYLYGANNGTCQGDTTYDLPDEDQTGTGWSCIWDTGGVDTLRYVGARDAVLDLTAATLDGSRTGGGALSYAANIHGGFTIANGVTIENAIGGLGHDQIVGNQADNRLDGGLGNDTLFGGGGNDILIGGAGVDVLNGGDGDDVLYIDSYDTTIVGGSGFDYAIVQGAADVSYVPYDANGIEVIIGGGGADTINAGATRGPIYIHGGDGNDTLKLGSGGGYLWGEAGHDTLVGGSGNDVLSGGPGADWLDGGGGNDVIYFDTSDRQIVGGAGFDYAIVDGVGSISASFSDFSGIEVAIGGVGNDRFDASGMQYFGFNAHGGDGDDTLLNSARGGYLFGDGGNDTLIGGAGVDVLEGGDGNDYLYFDDADRLVVGGTGDDVAIVNSAAPTHVVFGDDQSLETAIGNIGADTLDGSAVSTVLSLYGGFGDDTLMLGSGGGLLVGESGDDTLRGANGSDVLIGGAGADDLAGGSGDDRLYIDASDTRVYGDSGYDYAIFESGPGFTFTVQDIEGLEAVVGNTGDDTVDASRSNFLISLFGGAGNDALALGAGGGLMHGQDGDDTLAGGAGDNQYFGGGGADIFRIAAGSHSNYIQDYSELDGDSIDLRDTGAKDFATLSIDSSPGAGWSTIDANNTIIWVHLVGPLLAGDVVL